MSPSLEAVYLCDSAILPLGDAHRIVAGLNIPYVADMLFDAISTVEQVIEDLVIKGRAYER